MFHPVPHRFDQGDTTMSATLTRKHSTVTDQAAAPDPFFSPVVVRMATAGDRASLVRLAQLDSARPPVGEILIGELHGDAVAAVSLSDGREIADPFVAAGPILELVRLRAEQLGPKSRHHGRGSARERN
jgi:hypothetical protein